ncbi:hypothetical protein NL323_29080, partial [Klebsiella pneumoniae]|nr:hypothetical protein [Klebsiella pneumoniae]
LMGAGSEHFTAGVIDIASLEAHAAAAQGASATADYAQAEGAVTVDLSLEGAQDTGGAGVESFNGIYNLVGSDYDDTLIGNSADNVLNGGAGN